MDNWIKVTGNVLHGAGYFPAIAVAGRSRGQVFSSSPEGGSESMRLMYLLAITAATRSIDLSSAYFVPDALTQAALVSAAKRGVRIRIITPGEHMDAETVRRASRAGWGDLLQAGVEIHEFQPTMFHCKVLVVDGCGHRSARPTSTAVRSRSTTKPTSTSTMPLSPAGRSTYSRLILRGRSQ